MPGEILTASHSNSDISPLEQQAHPERFAEVNGYICGFICSGTQSEGRLWLDCLIGYLQQFDNELPADRKLLIELYKQISYQIQHESFGFHLTFPRTSLALAVRTLALKKWCHGFLEGLEQGGLSTFESSSSELKNSLQRFDNISKLEIDDLDINENDETMYLQIANFVELAVMEIYRIFHQGRAKH